ncbi:MAG: hypothetical protein GY771_06450, partial [bacterium]|nr:hypothetical protein [bacterium]
MKRFYLIISLLVAAQMSFITGALAGSVTFDDYHDVLASYNHAPIPHPDPDRSLWPTINMDAQGAVLSWTFVLNSPVDSFWVGFSTDENPNTPQFWDSELFDPFTVDIQGATYMGIVAEVEEEGSPPGGPLDPDDFALLFSFDGGPSDTITILNGTDSNLTLTGSLQTSGDKGDGFEIDG